MAMARDKNFNVRYDQALSNGDEIHGAHCRRNKIGNRPGFAERRDLDLYDPAAEGRNDDSPKSGNAARCIDVCFV